MPTIINEVSIQKKEKTNKFAPTRIQWNGAWLLRQEAFRPTVEEIVDRTDEEDVTKIGLIGKSGSGKTTLADSIAHVLHKKSALPWVIRRLDKYDLQHFDETIATLTNTNHILIFDDLSFLESKFDKKTIKKIEQTETEVRHFIGDHKIVLIYNYHYTRGLDKFLRQSDFRFFTTVGSEELDNMETIVHKRNMPLVRDFINVVKTKKRKDGTKIRYFISPRLYKKKFYVYKMRNPFIPILFWNNETLRFIVTPTRQWIDPICSICTQASPVKSQIDVPKFCAEAEEKFKTKTSWVNVIKQLLKEQGVNTYGSKYTQMRRYLDKALEMKQFNLDDLAVHYGLTVTKTKLRKKLDGEIAK